MSDLRDGLLYHIEKGLEAVENDGKQQGEKKDECNHTTAQHAVIAVKLVKDCVLVLVGLGAHNLSMAALKGLTFQETRMFAISRMLRKSSWGKGGEEVPVGKTTTLEEMVKRAGEDPDSLDFDSARVMRVRRG